MSRTVAVTDASLNSAIISQGVRLTSLKDVVVCLELHHQQLETWKSRPPSDNELVIAANNMTVLSQFVQKFDNEEYGALKAELTEAQKEIRDLTSQLNTLNLQSIAAKAELERVSGELARQKELFMLYDLSYMFRFYVANARVGVVFPGKDWCWMVEQVTEKNELLEDGDMDDAAYQAFMAPLVTNFGLDIGSLVRCIQHRHAIGHHDTRSKANQQLFMALCRTHAFSSEIKPLVDAMLLQLQGVTLRRMC